MTVNTHFGGRDKIRFSVGFASMDWSKVDDNIVPNGCTWYRCILPAQQLNIAGIHASFGFLGMRNNGKFVIRRLNDTLSEHHKIIVLKVIMSRQALEFIPQAKSKGQKIVVDIDDLFDEIHESNHAHQSTDASRSPDNNREIYKQIIAQSDALICSTPYIKEYYKKLYPDKPIYMVRNSIDIDRWSRFKAVKREPTIGWLGAVPWRSLDLEQMAPFFDKYLESRNVRFHHAGHINWAAGAHLRLKVDPKRCSASPMVPLFELPTAYKHFDIGIVPLNDIPFNRAKSFIKGLEYAAAGIPFVASALPEYQYLEEAGVGRTASSPAEWMIHFDELLNVRMREDESVHNFNIVKRQFSIQANAKQWIDVFTDIMNL